MAIEPTVSQDPSSDRDRLRLKFEVPPGGSKKPPEEQLVEPAVELPKKDALPQTLSTQAQQVEAARQLQTVRGKAKVEAEEEQGEEQQEQNLEAQQAVMQPAMVGPSVRQDLDKLKAQREEQLKKAQAKFKDRFQLEKKKKEIIAKFKIKAAKKAEKYQKIAKQKIEQMVADGLVTVLQEVGPLILELITWVCLIFAGVCGFIDWIADWVVSIFNLCVRGFAQYRRIQKVLGLGGESEESTGKIVESFIEKFLVVTVLPVVGATIMENIPYVDLLPWEEVGVGLSGLLIIADLIRSYVKVKSAENEARKMANS